MSRCLDLADARCQEMRALLLTTLRVLTWPDASAQRASIQALQPSYDQARIRTYVR